MNNVNFGKGGLFINDFHCKNSIDAQRMSAVIGQ